MYWSRQHVYNKEGPGLYTLYIILGTLLIVILIKNLYVS